MVVSHDRWPLLFDVPLNAPLTMDPKGRVTLPTRIFGALTERSMVWVPFMDHLRGYTPTVWSQRVEAPLLAEDSWDPVVAEKQRRRLGFACDLNVDEHGRFVLPPSLRQKAGLSRDCVFLSYLDRLELWDLGRWQAWEQRE